MAKKIYIGVNGAARNVTKLYTGAGGVARKIVKGYIGVNGIARLFYDNPTIPSGSVWYQNGGAAGTWYFTVPAGVYKIRVAVCGGGCRWVNSTRSGGGGGVVIADRNVSPGQVFFCSVDAQHYNQQDLYDDNLAHLGGAARVRDNTQNYGWEIVGGGGGAWYSQGDGVDYLRPWSGGIGHKGYYASNAWIIHGMWSGENTERKPVYQVGLGANPWGMDAFRGGNGGWSTQVEEIAHVFIEWGPWL